MVSKKETEHIATLSRLTFSDSELDEMSVHLTSMIGHFKMLDSVDTDGVSPKAHILPMVNVLREDVVVPPMDNATLLANAAETDDGSYIVPKVVE